MHSILYEWFNIHCITKTPFRLQLHTHYVNESVNEFVNESVNEFVNESDNESGNETSRPNRLTPLILRRYVCWSKSKSTTAFRLAVPTSNVILPRRLTVPFSSPRRDFP